MNVRRSSGRDDFYVHRARLENRILKSITFSHNCLPSSS